MFQHALVRSFSIRNTMHMLSNRKLGMFVMLNKMKTSNFFSWNYSVTNWLSQKTIHLSKINKEILSMALLSSACSLLYCLCDWLFIAIVLDYTHGFVIGPVINHSFDYNCLYFMGSDQDQAISYVIIYVIGYAILDCLK